MKYFVAAIALLASTSSFAANLCTKWEHKERFVKAIKVVATEYKMTYEELCNNPNILDIEAQPSRIILRDGTVIPHVQVQLHQSYQSCLIMVSDVDSSIAKNYCYSGW
ncbi:hypothetical protein [Bdellovibrio sp. HCB337]|uniref:hypothetical protein n=1 Tax=Bdellovibrio sp. HCB337 TaxID=3394358 RepID=UPI0039A5AED7